MSKKAWALLAIIGTIAVSPQLAPLLIPQVSALAMEVVNE